ncbi:MAG: tRNA lysidine(34) synthetase TilS [Vicinamibacterales bacterium]
MLVGLSGGSDSVALTRLLLDLSAHGGFTVAGVAHLNHQLRDTAGRDEVFCRSFATGVALPICVGHADVMAAARSQGRSLEDAARRERYAFLDRAAAELGADVIAVGHTRDDQAETFLLKLMRGAGLAGLAGVYPRRGRIVRPLLDTSRADLRTYLTDAGQSWVDDETNEDVSNPRNRIRHRIIPELDRALGGDSRPNLARAAALAREDASWLDEVADAHYAEIAREHPGGVDLDATALASLPPPLGRRVALRGLRRVAGGREVSLDHVDAVLGVARGRSGGADVPGGRVELRGGKAVLIEQTPAAK